MIAARIALVVLLVAACGNEAPAIPATVISPHPDPLPLAGEGEEPVSLQHRPFPRPLPTAPLDAAAFFPRAGDRWVRANTLPDVPSITSAF